MTFNGLSICHFLGKLEAKVFLIIRLDFRLLAWLIEKFIDEDMSPEELMVVAEQYLDPNSQYDKYFYDYLMEKAMEKYDL